MLMKRHLAHLVLVAAAQLGTAAPAEACGIGLRLTPAVPHQRSSNPSRILVLGAPVHRLVHELAAAGHDVDTPSSASTARRSEYDLIVVDDPAQADEARLWFAGTPIVIRSTDVAADLAAIEHRVRFMRLWRRR